MKIGAPAPARRQQQNGDSVPKKSRPSMNKREREFRKNQRQLKKAERAAAKRDKSAENESGEPNLVQREISDSEGGQGA